MSSHDIRVRTFQLSCIMRESHACALKTSTSRIEENFTRLTYKYPDKLLLIIKIQSHLIPKKGFLC